MASETKHYCPNMTKPGGCPLPNVHCNYPACDRPPVRSGEARQPMPSAADDVRRAADAVRAYGLPDFAAKLDAHASALDALATAVKQRETDQSGTRDDLWATLRLEWPALADAISSLLSTRETSNAK